MKLRNTLAALAVVAALGASAQQINPITQAMLDSYKELLAKNPKDYITLQQRAAQYYNMSEYDKALDDIILAISYTPEKEKDFLAQEYGLAANICIETADYIKALDYAEKALSLDPGNYPLLYMKGNICLYLKQPEEAYKSFQAMQRQKSRSQEAFFGMAKARIMQGNLTDIDSLIKQAEECDQNNYLTYCRIGDLYADMGKDEEAAANYLAAMSLTDTSDRPLKSLLELGATNFPAVSRAIEFAVSKTSNTAPFYYLEATIALENGYYSDAYKALESLLAIPGNDTAAVKAMQARAALALNKTDEAVAAATIAAKSEPTAANLTILARTLRASGKPIDAATNAQLASNTDPNYSDAFVELALDYIGAAQNDKALQSLNEAILADATNPVPLMLRAYLYDTALKAPAKAVADYQRVASLPAYNAPDAACKGIAQAKSGKLLDADSTVEKFIAENPSKDAYFYGAVYYAQTGNLEKGAEMLKKAQEAGFENEYLLSSDNTPYLSIAPIRHLK